MSWAVIVHPAVDEWLAALDEDSLEQVTAAVRELREHGPALGRPLADTVKGSRHRNMKELRPGSAGRSEIRVLFAFDRPGKRCCWWQATRPGGGSNGTSAASRSPMTGSTSTSSA